MNWTTKLFGGGLCLVALATIAIVKNQSTNAAAKEDLKPILAWVLDEKSHANDTISEVNGTKWSAKIQGNPRRVSSDLGDYFEFQKLDDFLMIEPKVTQNNNPLPKTNLSLVAWVRIDESTEWGSIIGCLQDNGDVESGIILGYNRNQFYFGLASEGANDGNGKMTYLTGKTNYEKGRWYQVIATYDQKSMKLYVNGELDAESDTQSGPVLYAKSAPLLIARYRDDNEDYAFQGAIKEVQICDHVLTEKQIIAHFRADAKLTEFQAPEAKPKFIVEPYLQFGTRTSMMIMCETNVPTKCEVKYGLKTPYDFASPAPTDFKTVHEISLKNLQPKSKYFYQVICTDAAGKEMLSKPLTFGTAVDVNDAYSFTVIGDTQRNPVITSKVAKLMWERRPNFVLHMGDVVNDGEIKQQWTDDLFKSCNELLSRVCIYPCLGNHERNHANYYKYFSLPNPEYYYTYSYGNAQFFVVDTNKPIQVGDEQYKWLESELAKSTAKWKFCYHHHPCYSSDSDDYGNTWKGTSKQGDSKATALIALYEKYKVDIAMNGHIHLYERTWPVRQGKVDQKNGTIYITSGGGGGSLEDFDPVPAFFKNNGRVDYHYCYFAIQEGNLECKVFDHEGRLFDSFNLKK